MELACLFYHKLGRFVQACSFHNNYLIRLEIALRRVEIIS